MRACVWGGGVSVNTDLVGKSKYIGPIAIWEVRRVSVKAYQNKSNMTAIHFQPSPAIVTRAVHNQMLLL